MDLGNDYGQGIPDLQTLDSILSEETLALNSSSSTEFEDENLNEKVDLISTTVGQKPPSIPLREERLSLGIECVFKAKGVGWSGVKKNRKKSSSVDNDKDCPKHSCYKPILTCFTHCSLIHDDESTPKNSNTTKKKIIEQELRALSYPEYVDYLLRCRAKKKEYVEHPYLELERSKDAEDALKKRIFTRQLEARQETFDLAAISDYITPGLTNENEVRQNPSVSFDASTQYLSASESPSKQRNTRLPKTHDDALKRVSFAVQEPYEHIRGEQYASLPGNDNRRRRFEVGCCADNSTLEDRLMLSERNAADLNAMECMGASDTTVPTTRTLLAVDINSKQRKREERVAKVLRVSRGSSIMDSVTQKKDETDEELSPISTVGKFEMHNSKDRENVEECRDDRNPSCDEREPVEEEVTCEINDVHSPSAESNILSYITRPRENRFHFYYPDMTYTENNDTASQRDVALQTSFTTSDSDATPLMRNESNAEYEEAPFTHFHSETSPSSSNRSKHHSVGCGRSFEGNVQSSATKLGTSAAKAESDAAPSLLARTQLKYDPSSSVERQPSSCSRTSFEDNVKSSATRLVTQASYPESGAAPSSQAPRGDTKIAQVSSAERQPSLGSPSLASVGCGTSFEGKVEPTPTKLVTPVSYAESDAVPSSHVTRDTKIAQVSSVDRQSSLGSPSCASVGCGTSFEYNVESAPTKLATAALNTESDCMPSSVVTMNTTIAQVSSVERQPSLGSPSCCAVSFEQPVESSPTKLATQCSYAESDAAPSSQATRGDTKIAQVPSVERQPSLGSPSRASVGCGTSFEDNLRSSPTKLATAALNTESDCMPSSVVTMNTTVAQVSSVERQPSLGSPSCCAMSFEQPVESSPTTLTQCSYAESDTALSAQVTRGDTKIAQVPSAERQPSLDSPSRASVGCGTSFENNVKSTPTKLVTQASYAESDAASSSQATRGDTNIAQVSSVERQPSLGSPSRASVGCGTSFEYNVESTPTNFATQEESNAAPLTQKISNYCKRRLSSLSPLRKEIIHDSADEKIISIRYEDNAKKCGSSRMLGRRMQSSPKANVPSFQRNQLKCSQQSQACLPPAILPPSLSRKKVERDEEMTWKVNDGRMETISLAEKLSNIPHSTSALSLTESSIDAATTEYIENHCDYKIPNSLSIESCHSSLYSDELSATTISAKGSIHKSSTNISEPLDTLSFSRSLPKSFSSSSYHSAQTSLSKSSSKTHEDVERCISYTLSELIRINSMLDEANIYNSVDSMSCNSESTAGRDALYYARQSKNEIAALHNLIEQHINKERERNFSNGKLLGQTLCLDNLGIGESSSFETMMSAKSNTSIVESPSIDRLIIDVSNLCTEIENRIENIVNDTNEGN